MTQRAHNPAHEPDWLESLDAVVAAPEHHSVLLENDRVRVLDVRVDPGDTAPVHTHRWPGVQYIVSFADFVRRDPDGELVIDSRNGSPADAPFAVWSEPIPPHTLENVGDRVIHAIAIELKQPPAEQQP